MGICLGMTSLIFSGIVEAHVVDIHIKTPGEIAEEERMEREKRVARDRKTYEDESRSEEDRRCAFKGLVEEEEVI